MVDCSISYINLRTRISSLENSIAWAMQRFTMSTIRTLIFFSGSSNCSLDWFNNHRCHLSWCISHRGDQRIHCDRSDSWSANLNYFFYHIFIGLTLTVLFIIVSFGCGLGAGPAELLNWIRDEFLQGHKCCSIQILFQSCVSFRQFIAFRVHGLLSP